MDNIKTKSYKRVLSALILAIGIATSGFFVGNSIYKFRMLDRQVSVKGLAEREVMSDFANWTITPKATANNIQDCYNKVEQAKASIIEFLNEQGFDKDEISFGNYTVNDAFAQSYASNVNENFRFSVYSPILLKTNKVELVNKATQSQNILIQKGIVFDNDGPYYEFTKFNDLKPEMLAEGIKNARVAAEKFATDAGIKIGSVKKANQGTFIIGPVGAVESVNSYENEILAKKSIYKKIRVVTTLEYFLEDN